MDDWVKKKLTEWHLVKWISTFEDEEVDQNCFKCLDEETVRKLIPKIGPQVLFWKRWQAEFGNLDPLDDSSQTTFFETSGNQIFMPTSSPENHQSPSISSGTKEGRGDFSSHKLNESFAPAPEQEVEESDENILSSSESESRTEELVFDIDNADLTLEVCDPISDLIKSLNNCLTGMAVLKYYRSRHELTDHYRNLLVDAVLNIELRSHPQMMLDTYRLMELTNLIIKTFPTENPQIYYAPYHFDEVAKKKVLARGKLYDRYHHLRGVLLQAGVVQSSRGQKRKCVDIFRRTSSN